MHPFVELQLILIKCWNRNGSLRLPIKVSSIAAISLLWGFLGMASRLLSIASGYFITLPKPRKPWGHGCSNVKCYKHTKGWYNFVIFKLGLKSNTKQHEQVAQLAEFEFYQKEAHAVLAVTMSWNKLKLIFIVLVLQNGFLNGNLPQLAKTVQ